MDRRLFVLAAFAAAGCATLPPSLVAAGPSEKLHELEPLLATPTREGVTLRVASNGCTGKADWAFYVERRRQETRIAFARHRLDHCRGRPGGTAELHFSWRELDLAHDAQLVVLNPQASP